MEMGLTGKTALITGASKGIGYAIAEGLAKEGCNVHLLSRSADALDAAAQNISSRYQIQAHGHAVDLSSSTGIEPLLDAIGTPDILVRRKPTAW